MQMTMYPHKKNSIEEKLINISKILTVDKTDHITKDCYKLRARKTKITTPTTKITKTAAVLVTGFNFNSSIFYNSWILSFENHLEYLKLCKKFVPNLCKILFLEVQFQNKRKIIIFKVNAISHQKLWVQVI